MLDKLKARHPTHVKLYDRWLLLTKMVAGGSAVDEKVKKQLLISPNNRKPDVIAERIKAAPYFSLMGAIMARIQSHLLAGNTTYTQDSNKSDKFWNDNFFAKGVVTNLGRVSFHEGLKQATLIALTQGSAIAVIDTSNVDARNKIQQQMFGGDQPYMIIRSREDLWDWNSGKDGLSYVKLHAFRRVKNTWDSDTIPEHEFTIYQREIDGKVYVLRYLIRPRNLKNYQNNENFSLNALNENDVNIIEDLPKTEIFNLDDNYPFPVSILEFDPMLCIADQLFDSQKSFFAHTAGLEWALLSTNYAQLIFSEVADEDELKQRIGSAGDGYYWALPLDVRASWLERSGEGIDKAAKYCDAKKAEMLEIIAQIAITAASVYTQLNRSGESKKEDRRNMDILLEVYGKAIAEFSIQNLETASVARGKSIKWAVDGFHSYDSDSLLQNLDEFKGTDNAINSRTFRIAAQQKLASQAIEALGLNQGLEPAILTEIENNSYVLSEPQLEFLESLVSANRLSNHSLLDILKKIKILPEDFDVETELNRLGTIPVNLATADDEEVLS